MQKLYFETKVQEKIKESLKRVHGRENKEDAMQCAYEAIADEGPISIDDACDCVYRAIERFRNRVRKQARHETGFDDSIKQNDDGVVYVYNYNAIPSRAEDFGSDRVDLTPSLIDAQLFMDTEKYHIPHTMYLTKSEVMGERQEAKERGKMALEKIKQREGR
jgi:hypothetical protein